MYKNFSLCFLLILFMVNCKNKPDNHTDIPIATKSLNSNNAIQTITFGSCNKEWYNQSYWDVIGQSNSDLWIWLGDIIYADTEDMSKLEQRYNSLKSNGYYQRFRNETPILGIWDDHDYGVNDGGKEYIKKKESKKILFDFLDVPKDNEAWQREGAYQSYTIGNNKNIIKVLLLDTRYFRDELLPKMEGPERYHIYENGGILGESQWSWLKSELRNSNATVNILVSGTQVLQHEQYFEKWANFPKDRKRLLDLLKEDSVKNVLLLSGDRHISELAKIDLLENKEIYEITSSGLTHSYSKNKEPNEFRVSHIIGEKSFGELKFEWLENEVLLNLRFLSTTGEEQYKYSWSYTKIK